ncbi:MULTISPECIES: acylphosphatase [Dyella]|uniref:acylphosphatase n=2 Tax=Dyella TaxID=231454 RepID=A0A4R0YPF3_9GAMM|nr:MULTISPECIES: acylphosphatase [Dyella]TBR37257.1 acylphosphatase [Dyella terrae]TCI07653.1 acylphosphatase [Dyella soli]
MASAHFIVSGRVQGVFYRASAREQALALGLIGYAKNLPDGTVEVLASGSESAIDALEQWLRRGPPGARVDRVTRTVTTPFEGRGFSTL